MQSAFAEAFGTWKNLKVVLLALVAIMFAQGAVWYTAFFYVQTFMEKFLKVDPAIINGLMMAATAVSAAGYVLFGWLSDKIGRKPVMLFGMTLMLVSYFPGFHMLSQTLNPAMAEAVARNPVTVIADPADCSVQFDPVGKGGLHSSCDIAKGALANAGVSYTNEAGPAGAPAMVRVGMSTISSMSATGLPKDVGKAVKTTVEAKIKDALVRSGYPAKADPARMNLWGAFGVLMVFVVAATALFGPIAACLVELFPTRIPLHGHVAALSRGDRLGRRLRAVHGLRHRGLGGEYLLGPLVSLRLHGDLGPDLLLLPAGDPAQVVARLEPSFPIHGKGGPSAERSEEPTVERESRKHSASALPLHHSLFGERSPSPAARERNVTPAIGSTSTSDPGGGERGVLAAPVGGRRRGGATRRPSSARRARRSGVRSVIRSASRRVSASTSASAPASQTRTSAAASARAARRVSRSTGPRASMYCTRPTPGPSPSSAARINPVARAMSPAWAAAAIGPLSAWRRKARRRCASGRARRTSSCMVRKSAATRPAPSGTRASIS